MRLCFLLWVGLLACGGGEDVAPTQVEEGAGSTRPDVPGVEPVASPVAPAISKKGDAVGDVPPVVLVWTGIGELHKGFFTTQHMVARLSGDLGAQVVPPANVHIRFDSRWHKGWIQLQLRPGTLRHPVGGEGDVIELQDLAGITQALATYRSAVGGRFDMRIDSFHVGIESYRGASRCVFGVGGVPPPDGRKVSNCVEINGQKHCGTVQPDGVRFEPGVAKTIRACLN